MLDVLGPLLINLSILQSRIKISLLLLVQWADYASPSPYNIGEVVCHILCYLKGAPGKGLLLRSSKPLTTTGLSYSEWACGEVKRLSDSDWACGNDPKSSSDYCTFDSSNIVTWHSRNKMVWTGPIQRLNTRLYIIPPLRCCGSTFSSRDVCACSWMYLDNQSLTMIAINPIFHEHTKHTKVDCHFICDSLMKKFVTTFIFIMRTSQATFSPSHYLTVHSNICSSSWHI